MLCCSTLINEPAIYLIILMQSGPGPVSSGKRMTLQSTVQCWAATPVKSTQKKAPNYSAALLLPDSQGQLRGEGGLNYIFLSSASPELLMRFQQQGQSLPMVTFIMPQLQRHCWTHHSASLPVAPGRAPTLCAAPQSHGTGASASPLLCPSAWMGR